MGLDRSLDTLLSQAQLAIDGALTNPQILAALSTCGYTPQRLQTGKQHYTRATAAQLTRTRQVGQQITATANLNAVWASARKSYIRSVKIARIAFKQDAGTRVQLGLNGPRQRTLSSWLTQADQFYQNALSSPTILSALGAYGITKAKLKDGLAQLEAVEAANLIQERAKGDVQAATEERNAAVKDLQSWLSDYRAIAKIALEDTPQQLEALGILQR